MRRQAFALAALVSVAAALLTAGIAAAGDTSCTGALGAVTVNGNLNVPAGASCTLTGTHVTGNVTVKQGPGDYPALVNLTTTGATIDGNVQVQRGGTSSLESSTVVGGNYQCDQCQFADLNNSTVKKNFTGQRHSARCLHPQRHDRRES
jgi:hypothetical protein